MNPLPSMTDKTNMWQRKSFKKGFAFAVLKISKALIKCTEDYEVLSVFKHFGLKEDCYLEYKINILQMLVSNKNIISTKQVFLNNQFLEILIKCFIEDNKKNYSLKQRIYFLEHSFDFGKTLFNTNEKIYIYYVVQLFKALIVCTNKEDVLHVFQNSDITDFQEKIDILGMIQGYEESSYFGDTTNIKNCFEFEINTFITGLWRLFYE